jgi:hypothetical protein
MVSRENPDCFPAWHGHKYTEVEQVNTELIQPFLDHVLNVICNGDRELYEVEMKKNAWIFQNPLHHMGWATVLVGSQGTGKSLYCNILCNLWGDLYSNPNVKVKHVTDDKAYKIVHYRKLIVCNELPKFGSKEGQSTDWEILKSRITDKTLKMRSMYHDFEELQERNVSNYMFCTNNLDSVLISHDDRRYFVLEVSEDKKGDQEYFSLLFDLSESDEFLQHLLTYLLHYDVSGLNVHVPPLTETKKEIIESQEPYSLQFIKLKENWRKGCEDDSQFVSFKSRIWHPYLRWLEDDMGLDSSRYGGRDNKFTAQLVAAKWLEKRKGNPLACRPGVRLIKFWQEAEKVVAEEEEEEPEKVEPTPEKVEPVKKKRVEIYIPPEKVEPAPEKVEPTPEKVEARADESPNPAPSPKRGRVRPKGSKNKPKLSVEDLLKVLKDKT